MFISRRRVRWGAALQPAWWKQSLSAHPQTARACDQPFVLLFWKLVSKCKPIGKGRIPDAAAGFGDRIGRGFLQMYRGSAAVAAAWMRRFFGQERERPAQIAAGNIRYRVCHQKNCRFWDNSIQNYPLYFCMFIRNYTKSPCKKLLNRVQYKYTIWLISG